MRGPLEGLRGRQYYALIWKDFVVHKRHYVWSTLEMTIPIIVCAMAILSNTAPGKPKLEPERSFEPDDYERLYGELNPQHHKMLVAPNTSFTRALVSHIDDGAVTVELCGSERELVDIIKAEIPVSLDQVKRLIPDDNANKTISGVVIESDMEFVPNFNSVNNITANNSSNLKKDKSKDSYYYEVISKLDGKRMMIPVNFDMIIRAKDFRLGAEPFPKKFSLGPFLHSDHYTSTYFMASQIMLSRAYINLLLDYMPENDKLRALNLRQRQNSSANVTDKLKNNIDSVASIVIPTNDNIIGQRMPYPKYVTHKRLKETTLGTFVAGSQKQKPFVLTMDYCITLGFLVTATFLAKRIVDEKKSRVRDMLRLVGISDPIYYGSHMSNTMLIMLAQCLVITILFTGHPEAPAQNIDSSLLFVLLIIYCLSAVMFVLYLSTLFESSTMAIIFTVLMWLGLPEVLDRVFKLNAGVIESNGYLAAEEPWHLLFCLMPNFAIRLANRLLTESDIYGEFFAKKHLYGEYRAIWSNINNLLPLYKSISLAKIMLIMIISLPFYAILIKIANKSQKTSGGLAGLTSDAAATDKKSASRLIQFIRWSISFVCSLILAPFRLVRALMGTRGGSIGGVAGSRRTSWSTANLNHATPTIMFAGQGKRPEPAGYLNGAFASGSLNELQLKQQTDLNGHANKIQLTDLGSKSDSAHSGAEPLQIIDSTNYSKGYNETMSNRAMNDERYFERSPAILTTGVSIRNLSKTYITSGAKGRRIEAVKNVSLDMFYSQILVLLGHNGAGKTTLIDIISGHNKKSSGKIFINGYDIDTQPSEARRKVGFCPQFDVLFERLTVEEHLYFYGIVKGARKELKQEIEELLVSSELDRHRHKLSKNLSGGYKRKLSLAIAMIAGSKVLILDEPTSGMDPESRRKVWDFLQLIRHDRLILMTTHHMEEADALGDRVAVMSGGQVKCCGSALFLKRIFDAGYHLRISKSSQWNQLAFDELIGIKYKLADKLENLTPHELMYKFDAHETSKVLPSLFDDLEQHKERVGIFGFGVTVSTMDDVFMKIGVHFKDLEAREMELQQKAQPIGNGSNEHPRQAPSASVQSIAGDREQRLTGSQLVKHQMRALLTKRFNHAKRNIFQLIWILGVSLACVVGTVILIDLIVYKEELTPEWSRRMTLVGAGYGERTKGVYQFASPSQDDDLEALREAAFGVATTSTAEPPKVETASSELPASTMTTVTTSRPESSSSEEGSRPTENPVRSSDSLPSTEQPSESTTSTGPVIESTTISQPANRRRKRQVAISSLQANESVFFMKDQWLPEAKKSGLLDEQLLIYSDVNSEMIELLTREFADFREKYIVGGEKQGNKYIAWYNGEATHSFPISMNIMLNSILRGITDLIQDSSHPLKGSRISLKHEAMAQINTKIAFLPHLGRLINLVFLPFSLAFITSYFVIFPTHERVTKSKHLQLMTGVAAKTFWLSHFIFDLLLYGVYTISVLAIYFVWDRVINDRKIYFANFDHSVALISLIALFIFAALPQAYIFSFLAKRPTSAFSSFCVLTIVTGIATLILVSLYELKYEYNASNAFRIGFTIFLWLSRLVPSVSLLIGLQKLFSLNTTRSICINISPEVLDLLCRYVESPLIDEELRVLKPERCCKKVCNNECFDQWPFFWSGWFGINTELAMLLFDAMVLWLVLVIIESSWLRARLCATMKSLVYMPSSLFSKRLVSKVRSFCWQVPSFIHDRDLQKEQQRIESIIESGSTGNYSLVVSGLSKVYSSNKFKAVDQLGFVVDKCEFFGLLGVNGAGKSTTFKMLTGEIEPTAGSSYVGHFDVATNRRQYLKRIGYCPQQDALIDNLTGSEMLSLFARLRGLPERQVGPAVNACLEGLGLKRMARVECNNYSGGNKRRLSVGMALIGAPEVVFLDEPTSGVDPRSRRRLWSTLIEFQQQTKSAIVMTSHSMNECECLCDRVAIMVAGQFKVQGSVQFLRTKLSQGFSLILKLKPDNLREQRHLTEISDKIHRYMSNQFQGDGQIQLKDLHQTIVQYHIKPHEKLSWSKMLLALERAKEELDLEDYQITSDASLESIFLSLAKNQKLN